MFVSVIVTVVMCLCALLSVMSDVEDSSIPHMVKLIHPKLEYQLQLAKKMNLLDALKVCSFDVANRWLSMVQ